MVKNKGTTRNSVPVSVLLPPDLKAQVQAEARKRGLKLSPALRVLVSEHIRELDDAERLTRAEEWQRAQAWGAWERLQAGDRGEVSRSQIDADFDRALHRRRRSRVV